MAASNTTHAPRWSNRESWFIVCVYCGWETIALLLSTLYSFSQPVVQEVYGVPSNQVATLGQSMQIIGNLFGVAVLSPLSDEYGRKKVTIASMLAYSLFNLGTAYAPNFITLIAFMFMSGFAWSTSLSFVPAVFSDLYLNRDDIGQPIALFVIGASVGPTLGVIVATALMEADVDLKWYFLVIVFGSAACTLPMLLVPETSTPKSSKTEEQGGNAALLHSPSVTPLKQANRSTADTRQLPGTHFFLTRVWVLLTTEPIMWITGVYNGLANGVFVLTVGGAITTLTEFKGLPMTEAAGPVSFVAIGVILVWFVMPVQTRLYREDTARRKGHAQPESRLLLIHDVLWLFPAALFWAVFTSGAHYSKWHQAVTVGLVAFTDSFLYQCLLIYIIDLYPQEAASATAAWLIPCFPVQAATVHFGVPMFLKLGPEWGFGLLALFTTGFVLPGFYAIKHWGPQMRQNSPAITLAPK